MRVRTIACVVVVAVLAFLSQAQAASISYVGSVGGAEAVDWRTSTTAKSLDIDQNNIYGSLGAVQWTVGSTGEQPSTSSTNLGWHFVGIGNDGFQWQGAGYSTVNSILGGSNIPASLVLDYFQFALTGTSADYSGKAVRVGILEDFLTPGEWAGDYSKTLAVQELDSVGNVVSTSPVVSLRNGAIGTGTPTSYFFDIANVTPGTTYRIATTSGSNQQGYIGEVSWDIGTIPEPSTLVLLVTGLIGLLCYAWRKRK